MAKEINTAILKLRKRSEKYSTEQLVNTFVDVGSLFTQLMNNDHQILYGRRGTGKTHVLKYLCSKIENEGSYPIYIDLRLVGSTGGLYSDRTIPVSERATRLLIDVFSVIHDQIFEFIAEDNREDVHMGTMGPLLEELATSISEIKISGEITKENLVESNIKNSNNVALTLGTAPNIGFTKDCCIGEKIGEKNSKYWLRKS